MDLRLDGKNALVCGSSKGIGKAIAMQFAEMGADVILMARSEAALKDISSGLPCTGGQTHTYIVADFQDYNGTADKVGKIINSGQTIHILVNNSGGPPPGKLIDAQPEDFRLAFERHLFASQLLVQKLLPAMKSAGFGRIINVISISVRQPIDNLGVSNTLRGAMASWSKTLSRELAPFGITVNNLLPGHTRTERLKSLFETNAKNSGISPEVLEASILKDIPVGRFAQPEELGYAAGFLASSQAGFITGMSLAIDGGFLKCL